MALWSRQGNSGLSKTTKAVAIHRLEVINEGSEEMRLSKVQIKEFQSIQNSSLVEIGDVTCLLGKNETG